MQDLIAKAKQQAQQAELYQITVTETPVRYENNKLKGIDASSRQINALRIVKDGKLGFATSTGDNLQPLLDMALATAQFGRDWDLPLPGPAALPQVQLTHPSTVLDTDTLVEMGEKLVSRLGQCHPDLLASADVSTRQTTTKLINSQGFAGEYSKSIFSILGGAELTEGKNFLSLYAGYFSGKREDQLEKTIESLVSNYEHGRTNVPVKSGKYTVIFTPQGLGDIINPLLECANGLAVEKGFSPWKDKLGEKLFAEEISLYDDATISFAPASCLFDGEGIPAQRTAIIEKGVINSFILNMVTAKALGLKSTGNGFRSKNGELSAPGNSNVVLEIAGTQPLEQLLGSVKQGIIIHSLMGAWAGNPYSGQVNGNIALGFLVEDGRIKGRVKDCMVSVNVFEAFRHQIEGASAEKEWAWNMLAPHLKLRDISISAKS
ncbi:MAG: metallopeptidase TldD-related protein [Eubacteriales bacterium]|nr:metallopeptidase TldD-related protein [Eubacteriales bacterium]